MDDMREEDVSDIFNRLDLKTIDEPMDHHPFSCFDVNEFGEYVLGFGQQDTDMILVYDSDGSYVCGFSIKNSGNLGALWENGSIVLYLSRSDLAVSIDRNGKCVNIRKIQNTMQNNEFWNQVVYANRRDMNGVSFTAENGPFTSELLHWGAYHRLVKTTPDGERVVLYDTSSDPSHFIWVLGMIFLLFLFFGFVFMHKIGDAWRIRWSRK